MCGGGGVNRKRKWVFSYIIQRVSKRMTRFQIIISNKEDKLQLYNKLQTTKQVLMFNTP